jgi:hypothetical protein
VVRVARRDNGSQLVAAICLHLIHIKSLRANEDHSAGRKNDQNDAADHVRKAEEYRDKARATVDTCVKSALEAVARELMRKARDLDETVARGAGVVARRFVDWPCR